MDAVLVATGYLVGAALFVDEHAIEVWPLYRNLAVALPFFAVVHLGTNGLGGVYRFPPWSWQVSTGTKAFSTTVAVLLLVAWTLASTTRILPLSVVLFGGLATVVLMVMAQFGRSMGRELSERLFPST